MKRSALVTDQGAYIPYSDDDLIQLDSLTFLKKANEARPKRSHDSSCISHTVTDRSDYPCQKLRKMLVGGGAFGSIARLSTSSQ